ncbi:PREDICTED: uncharacterized protein LOC104606522 [Nelumbo nucifera]|uniref:Uncharacterized protein LOC104606522 n=1 Tax=Nelumbo nucifera TaxID=4432 RepID=A0A1U8B273_NELNU|nr:PREDICTED: uncharacterized protein LOC104606522 [Nelumbo nucifera]XP_010270074.1 PREDICTED: uncharacterized protein LOC104606522 [Nelumbo nucifera]
MEKTQNILVIWRGRKLNVEINSGATLKDLGHKLQKLTNVKANTMRLLVPRSSDKSSNMFIPFSGEHSNLSLLESSILENKPIRMMGVFEDEVEEVLQNEKVDLRIAGFDEEERRLRQRMIDRPTTSLKLPQGTCIFCDFRTLHIPGIELYPPASEALRIMHMLAADPGIIAIMNKHRWRVGVMTEMAPVGYVGISPKCILGFNKNQGEEISLRLRTDDLKGFRKYESIKKTLLHELAHMVYSEHDANFYALDKQLNQEAASLDWTKSRSHTLTSVRHSEHYEEEFYTGTRSSSSQKLGGKMSDHLASACASSVAAAYRRLAETSTNTSGAFEVCEEPDPDDSLVKEHMQPEVPKETCENPSSEPHPNHNLLDQNKFEPDPNDSQSVHAMDFKPYLGVNRNRTELEPDPDDRKVAQSMPHMRTDRKLIDSNNCEEPDPDDTEVNSAALKNKVVVELDRDENQANETMGNESQLTMNCREPDPDDSEFGRVILDYRNRGEPDPDDSQAIKTVEHEAQVGKTIEEPDPDDAEVEKTSLEYRGNSKPDPGDSHASEVMQIEPDPDDKENSNESSRMHADEPDPDDQELQRIQDPVSLVCTRLQKAIEVLRSEVNSTEANSVLQTLCKIVRNVIEHPDEIKFRRLRKANPMFQRNVANYKAAMEVLFLVGFNEDVLSDEVGRVETYMVLKRNDPALLWLAKSSLEMCIAY